MVGMTLTCTSKETVIAIPINNVINAHQQPINTAAFSAFRASIVPPLESRDTPNGFCVSRSGAAQMLHRKHWTKHGLLVFGVQQLQRE